MGGNALKNTYTERKNTNEFLRIGKEIQNRISMDIKFETTIVKCYHTKADHGDLDLLIKIIPNSEINLIEYIKNTFKPNEIINNGNVISFDFNQFQIDFIKINQINWEIAQTYMNYDCIGNIMGKTFHKFGLSYGWDGLFYKFRNFNGRLSQNILISNNARRIFAFGDYDYDRYLQGFETLEDILKFTINCKYFDTEIFQMDNLKSIDKKRNRKRGSYHIFLKYLKDNEINIKYPFEKDKELYLPMINEAFPEVDLLGQLYDLKMKDNENKILSQKFNGDIVMSWLPKLQGKELGQAIKKFKESFDDDGDYRKFVLNACYTSIESRFMDTYNDRNYQE